MRILIADKLAPFVSGALQDLGAEVRTAPALDGDALRDELGRREPDVLVVRSTRVTAEHLRTTPSLALVVRAGAGVNTIDLPAASAQGIFVANCPGRNAAAVAELTIAHLLNLDRRMADNVAALRSHRWDKKAFGQAHGLCGRSLAVLGCGGIGRAVIERAQGLGMRVVAWSRSLDDAEARRLGVERFDTPEEAVRGADAITVHLALAPDTWERIGASVFEAMRPGALFVNTARGELVDHDALLSALEEKGLRVGLDVYPDEPRGGEGEYHHPIVDNPNVYGTHHIGASTDQAEEAVGYAVVDIVRAYQAGATIPSCVNVADTSPATHMLVVRHADEVGVLAAVLNTLSRAGLNVQEMQNVVFNGSDAACARIALEGAPDAETLERLRALDHVMSATLAGT